MSEDQRSLIEGPCGAVLEGVSRDDVVDKAQTHAKQTHDMDMSRDQALAMARPA